MAEEINNTTTTFDRSDTYAEENRAFDTEVLDSEVLAEEDELAGTTSVGTSNSMGLTTPPAPLDSSDNNANWNSQAIKEQAKEKTQQVLAQTKETAGLALDKAKEQAVSKLSEQKEKASDSLGSITNALHSTTQSFRDENQHFVADYVDSFANQVDRFSHYVSDKSVEELARDVDKFARQNPALFIGGAFLIGIGIARFLKSSNTYDTIPRNEALVPVSPSPVSTPLSSPMSNPVSNVPLENDKIIDEFGEKPLSAHNYVAGIGINGNGENN
jgi:hypothetical protein